MRRVVEVPPILVRINPARPAQRLDDGGAVQRALDAGCDLIGLGVSAISHLGESFSQNFRELRKWDAALAAGRLPVSRGLALSHDDQVRAAVIGQLMCQGVIDIRVIEQRFGVNFLGYFGESLARLETPVADGLVVIADGRITVTSAGRLLLRSIAMCFDAYLEVAPRAARTEPAPPLPAVPPAAPATPPSKPQGPDLAPPPF